MVCILYNNYLRFVQKPNKTQNLLQIQKNKKINKQNYTNLIDHCIDLYDITTLNAELQSLNNAEDKFIHVTNKVADIDIQSKWVYF